MAVISELKTRSKNLCQKFDISYPFEADMELVKFPIKANTLYSINFNTTKEAYKTVWLYDNDGNLTKRVTYAYAPQLYDKMVVFSENDGYMSVGVLDENAKVIVAEGQYFTLNTTQQNNLNNNKITTSVSGGELPYEPYYVDITKYNNATISNINLNGVDYHFAKQNEVYAICDNAVEEPIIDMKISGNSQQDGIPTPEVPIEIESVGDYDQETGKYKVPVNVSGKNLLNKETSEESYFINASGVITFNEYYALAVTEKIYVKPSTTYTYSGMGDVKSTTVGRTGFQYDKDGNPIIAISQSYGEDVVFTTEPNCHYVLLQYVKTQEKPMLEENITATTYEPYLNKTTNIYLNEPLRKIGDYADYIDYKNKKVVRNIKEKVFDTSNNWNYMYNKFLYANSSEVQYNSGADCYCSHYLAVSAGGSSAHEGENNVAFLSSINKNQIWIIDNRYTDLESFKEYLLNQYNAGTPIKVYFPLETPIEETIDIPEISTSKGTNKFTSETTIEPSELKITYWKQI